MRQGVCLILRNSRLNLVNIFLLALALDQGQQVFGSDSTGMHSSNHGRESSTRSSRDGPRLERLRGRLKIGHFVRCDHKSKSSLRPVEKQELHSTCSQQNVTSRQKSSILSRNRKTMFATSVFSIAAALIIFSDACSIAAYARSLTSWFTDKN